MSNTSKQLRLIAMVAVGFVLVCGVSLKAQTIERQAQIEAANPVIDNQYFLFDILMRPTGFWGSGTYDRALGNCSWFFEFNTTALNQPELVYVAPEIDSLGGYRNMVEIVSDRLAITTHLDLGSYTGGQFLTGEMYHLFTVRMQIVDVAAQSGITWDTLNTGVLTLPEHLVRPDFICAADIQLTTTGVTSTGSGLLPEVYSLHPNYPNPFNPASTIPFDTPAGAAAETLVLDIFDISGRRVRTLFTGSLPPGQHTRIWDGRDDAGYQMASGVFFVRLTATGFTATRRIILIR